MSKSDGVKEVTIKPDSDPREKSIQEQRIERNEAMEADRVAREKPRTDYMLTGKGKASDHFELVTDRETVERYTNQDGAPQSVEELSESAREKWLRTGELPEKKSNGKPAEKKAEETDAAKPEALAKPERPKLADYRDEESGEIKQEDYEKALDKYEADKTAFEKQEAEPKKTEQERTEPTQEDREPKRTAGA
jgi:hypothetical protein